MDDLFKWLYEYESAIEILFGSVSLFTTLVVIILNFKSNQIAERAIYETKLIRELEKRPYLYFYMLIERGGEVMNFEVANRGNGIARNIKVTLDQELKIHRRREEVSCKEMAILKPLSFLAPSSSFKEYADIPRFFFQVNEHILEVTGKIEYEDGGGKKYQTPVCFNLKSLGNRRFLISPSMDNVVSAVEGIHQVIQRKR